MKTNKIKNSSASSDIIHSLPLFKELTNFAYGSYKDFVGCSIENSHRDSNESQSFKFLIF